MQSFISDKKMKKKNVILQFDTQMSADCLTSYADYFSNFVTSLEFQNQEPLN